MLLSPSSDQVSGEPQRQDDKAAVPSSQSRLAASEKKPSHANCAWVLVVKFNASGMMNGASAISYMIRERLLTPFPIHANTRYRSLSKGRGVVGIGRSLKLTSNSLLIRSEYPAKPELKTGARLEVSLDWPYLPGGPTPLEMLMIGTVLRCRNSRVALSIERCQFRIVKNRNPHPSSILTMKRGGRPNDSHG